MKSSFLKDYNYNYFPIGTMVYKKKCIDYIFSKNIKGVPQLFEVNLSDHYPIMLTFDNKI